MKKERTKREIEEYFKPLHLLDTIIERHSKTGAEWQKEHGEELNFDGELLWDAFGWEDTPEGYSYWFGVNADFVAWYYEKTEDSNKLEWEIID